MHYAKQDTNFVQLIHKTAEAQCVSVRQAPDYTSCNTQVTIHQTVWLQSHNQESLTDFVSEVLNHRIPIWRQTQFIHKVCWIIVYYTNIV